MTTVLCAKGVTMLMTSELEDRFHELRFSPYGSAVLADAVIMQRYVESASELRTVISVVKVRARSTAATSAPSTLPTGGS